MDPRPSMMAIQAMIVLMLAVYQLLFLICLVCAYILTTPKQESGEDEPSENPLLDLLSQERGNIIDEVVYRLTTASRRWKFLREVLIFFLDGPKTTSHWDYNMNNFGNCFSLVKEFVKAVNDWMNVGHELTARSGISNSHDSRATCLGKSTYQNSDDQPHQPEAIQQTNSKIDKEVQTETSVSNIIAMPKNTGEQGMQYSDHSQLYPVAAGSQCTEETLEREDDIDIRVPGQTTTARNDLSSHCQIPKVTNPTDNVLVSHAEDYGTSQQTSRAAVAGTSSSPPLDVSRKQKLCPYSENETQIHSEVHSQAHQPVISSATDKPVMSEGRSPGEEPSVQQVQNDHNSSAGTASNGSTLSANVIPHTSPTSNNHYLAIPENITVMKRSRSLPCYMSKNDPEKSLTKRSRSLSSVTDHFTGSTCMSSLVTMTLTSDKDIRKTPEAVASGLHTGLFPHSSYETSKPIEQTDKVAKISSEDTISQHACAAVFHPMTDLQGQPMNRSSEERILEKSDRTRHQHQEQESTEDGGQLSRVTHDTELETSLDSSSHPVKRVSTTEETMTQKLAEEQSDKNTTGHFGNDKPREAQDPELAERQNNSQEPSAQNGQRLLDHKESGYEELG